MKTIGKIKVLYIDDEPNNLIGFKASFRLRYQVLTANSADEGRAILEQHNDIVVVICDQKMPGKTGVQFFEEISISHPTPVRMLLTGYTDIESVINAINRGHIFRYITKPWLETDIHSAIEEGYKYYVTTSMLNTRNHELEQAYEELDKFTYNVTHYLRSPLVSIQGALELAVQSNNIDEIKDILRMMKNSLNAMDDFIKNIHGYFTIKQGELTIETVDFNSIAESLREQYADYIQKENIRFDITINQQESFRTDRNLVEMILNNLLSNAFKFQKIDNPSKFVSLRVDINRGSAVIQIEDNGIGIDPTQTDNIFKMFYRASSEREGSGFGLYNVSGTLKKLNGEIKVSSTPGSGTIFTVTIPGK